MTKRPPNEEDLQAMFGLLEEARIMLTHWAHGSQTPSEEIQQLRDENAQLKAVLNHCLWPWGKQLKRGDLPTAWTRRWKRSTSHYAASSA